MANIFPQRVLDLFCGAGGAAMGLHRAWPDARITGVDIKPQKNYPFNSIQADAMTFDLDGYDFIWASPPCQKYTALKTMPNAKTDHVDLVEPIRQRLIESEIPYVIENVPNAPLLVGSVMLCGTMFDLGIPAANAELRRHRWFESNFPFLAPSCRHMANRVCGVYGGHGRDRRRTVTDVAKQGYSPQTVGVWGHAGGKSRRHGTQMFSVKERKEAMGIDWMTDYELSQSIPPAYSEFIARQYSAQAERG
jgi:DNA (cytosine-5)-methyltransferase 1